MSRADLRRSRVRRSVNWGCRATTTSRSPLAVALLIAAVGSVLLTVMLGTARITRLRRRIRKQRN
jgi:uncharacterized integral membrane protein